MTAEQGSATEETHGGFPGRYGFRPAEVVVAAPHSGIVEQTLARHGVDVSDREPSPLLGLARLELVDVDEAARALSAAVDALGSASDPRRPEGDALGRVLWALRRLVADEHAGWAPTIGKNRLVGQTDGGEIREVAGGGVISHGGGTEPEAVAPPEGWPAAGAGVGAGVRVGVLDTGLSPHPALAGGWAARFSDRLPAAGSLTGRAGHATFIAGLVLSQAPGATVEVRQVLDNDTASADSWSVATAIVEYARSGVDVLNLSFLCHTVDGEPPMALAAAVDRLDPDIVVVAAAGNHGELPGTLGRRPAWPAALDDVIAVGAADSEGARAGFSPADAPWVDVLAPGVDLVSTFLSGDVLVAGGPQPFDGYARWSGTSFAAALVSGVIAAGTQPGRVSAREAWEDIAGVLRGGVSASSSGPPFLRLPGF